MKAPAFLFYPKDWDADENIVPMTYEEEGVYWHLCRRYWLAGSLPSDLDKLRVFLKGHPSLEKMREWWKVIGPCFRVRGGKLTHKRLDIERKKQAKNRKARKLAAEKRWKQEHENGNANASGLQCLTSTSAITSTTAVSKKTDRDEADALAQLWNDTTQAPIPRCSKVTPKRRKTALARLRERPMSEWALIFDRINASAFCRAETGGTWLADFDWAMKPETAVRVLEGKYDDRKPAKPQPLPRALMGMATEPLPEIWYMECDRIHETRCANGMAHYDKRDAERAEKAQAS